MSVRIAAFIFLALLSSCTTWGYPFLDLQICVQDRAGLALWHDEFRKAAEAHMLAIVDRSAEVRRELEGVGYPNDARNDGSPLLRLHAYGANDFRVTASNVGIPGYRIHIAFFEGSNQAARLIADDIVARLERHWKVHPWVDGLEPNLIECSD